MEKHKLFFFLFIAALMVVSITVFSSHPPPKADKKNQTGFSFAQDTIDIGYLLPDNTGKEIPLKIYNHEDTALQVQDVVSSCGCVLTDKKNFFIAHNDSSIIKTIIQAKKGDIKGIIHRTIAVRTNYTDPIKYVVIKAHIT